MAYNGNEQYYELLLTELLECGYSDLKVIVDLMDMMENLRVRADMTDVFNTAKDVSGRGGVDFNALVYALMSTIFYDLISDLPDDVKKRLKNKFDPFINYLDSYFNIECLDYYDGESREEILDCLKREAQK